MALNSWIQILTNQLIHLGHYPIITALNSWSQILIGTIAGFLIASLILTLLSSEWTKKKLYQQSLTSARPSIDTFIESIENSPRPPPKPKPKPKTPIPEHDLWAQQLQQQQKQQQQADKYNSDNDDEYDDDDDDDDDKDDSDDPGETSLFAEDYISQTEHNRAFATLNSEISKLIKRITARDQLLQKSRAETIKAEGQIDQLQDEIKRLRAKVQQGKRVIDDLQVSHIEKGKLIYELRAQLVRPTHEVPPEKMNPARWSGQAQQPPVTHQATAAGAGAAAAAAASAASAASAAGVSESQQQKRAKDVLTYIPPNRRPTASNA